ncbi:MAG: aspartate carbamoyltransferase [Halobacteriales archaeon]
MRQQLISTRDLPRAEIEAVLDRAAEIDDDLGAVHGEQAGALLGLLFYEPSTRTRLSFAAAINRLGGDTVSLGSVEASSVAKGETLADTARTVAGYVDALVLRHPREGAAAMASEYVDVPLINAGDGAGQHPSQTLLDLYTIREHAGLNDLSIGIMGDLKYGRTVHSLAGALTRFDASQHFISPPSLALPESVQYDLDQAGAEVTLHTELESALGALDVLYVTRIQRERFPDEDEYRAVAGQYQIDAETLAAGPDDLKVMHPLPRIDEIAADVDDTDHAIYFEQAKNGVPVRMALLDLML